MVTAAGVLFADDGELVLDSDGEGMASIRKRGTGDFGALGVSESSVAAGGTEIRGTIAGAVVEGTSVVGLGASDATDAALTARLFALSSSTTGVGCNTAVVDGTGSTALGEAFGVGTLVSAVAVVDGVSTKAVDGAALVTGRGTTGAGAVSTGGTTGSSAVTGAVASTGTDCDADVGAGSCAAT